MIKRKVFLLGDEFLFLQDWIHLNPDYEFESYNLDKARQYLLEHFSQTYLDILDYIEDTFIKFDFLRLCLLLKNGGIFIDDTLIPVCALKDFIFDDVDIITCINQNKIHIGDNNKKLFHTNFIFISNLNNGIIKACIDKYIDLYFYKVPFSWTNWTLNHIFGFVIYEYKDINFTDSTTHSIQNYNCLFINQKDETLFILNNKLLFKAI
jgi:hypothetical protein